MSKMKIQIVYNSNIGIWTIQGRFDYSDEELDIIIKAAQESKRRHEHDRKRFDKSGRPKSLTAQIYSAGEPTTAEQYFDFEDDA